MGAKEERKTIIAIVAVEKASLSDRICVAGSKIIFLKMILKLTHPVENNFNKINNSSIITEREKEDVGLMEALKKHEKMIFFSSSRLKIGSTRC